MHAERPKAVVWLLHSVATEPTNSAQTGELPQNSHNVRDK